MYTTKKRCTRGGLICDDRDRFNVNSSEFINVCQTIRQTNGNEAETLWESLPAAPCNQVSIVRANISIGHQGVMRERVRCGGRWGSDTVQGTGVKLGGRGVGV